MTMLDLPFDLVELVPCPASLGSGAGNRLGTPLREVAYHDNAWLPEDIDALRQGFGDDEDLREIAVRLDRTLDAVRTKVNELGLRRNSSRPWSDLDDEYMARHYGSEATSAVAAALGRSCGAVYARAGLLELTEANAPNYSAWELAQIGEGYRLGVPVAQLGVLIGRPASGIATVASRLGIKHANAPRGWSSAEQERALALAETRLPYAAIADVLETEGFPRREGRTVGQTLRLLGYGRGWGRPWLPEEDDLIRDAYTHGKSLTPLRTRLGRSRTAIAHRTGELGLRGTHARPNGWRTNPPWTEEDIAILRRDYGTVPTPELAKSLGRKKSGVYNKAFSLGLKHGFLTPFSDEDERAIRIAHCQGISITDVGAALDRDVAVVSKHAIRMGIPFGTRTNKAPRGPRRASAPVTLPMLLAMDEAEGEAARPE